MRGNVVDMGIGVVIGAAFGAIATSFVKDVLTPPLGLLFGGADFANLFMLLKTGAKAPGPYQSLAEAQAAGAVTLNYGVFLNTIVSFLIVAFALFLVVKAMNSAKKQEAAAPPAPPAPTATETLLAEIRDLLKKK